MELKFAEWITHNCRLEPIQTPAENLMRYNPVEEHLLALRKCTLDVNNSKRKARKELKEQKKRAEAEGEIKLDVEPKITTKKRSKKSSLKKSIAISQRKERSLELPKYSIPIDPLKYPFENCSYVNTRLSDRFDTRVMFKGQLHERTVAKFMKEFITNVLIETGYFVPNVKNDAVNLLIEVTHMFLKTFIFVLARNRRAVVTETDGEDDLYGPLEKTVREIGVGGIRELHRFYYEKIVKKHDRLLTELKCNIRKYDKLRLMLEPKSESFYQKSG